MINTRRNVLRRVFCLALTLFLILPLAVPGVVPESSAVTQADIDKLKKDAGSLADQRKDIQNQLKALQTDKSKAMNQKELLEQQISVIRQEIANINSQITMYNELIDQKTAELAQAEADEAAQFDLFCRRMRHMEEQGEISYWAILFSSSSFSELLDNYMMIEEIIQYDNKVIKDLEALQAQVTSDKAALEEARTGLEEARAQQAAIQKQLKDQEGEVDKLIGQISAQEDQLEAMEAELKKAASDLDAEIKRKEKEYAEQIKSVVSESGFQWPLPANQNGITSYYGSRPDPFTGQIRNHTGLDISAPKGTPIYAAKSGVVTTSKLGSGSSWAYGEHVVISHSDGTSTLYGHMSSRSVQQGQTVKQGTVIGYVGSTGRSTGNHLHLEVRVHGNRTDPLKYYKDKSPLYFVGKSGRKQIQ